MPLCSDGRSHRIRNDSTIEIRNCMKIASDEFTNSRTAPITFGRNPRIASSAFASVPRTLPTLERLERLRTDQPDQDRVDVAARLAVDGRFAGPAG